MEVRRRGYEGGRIDEEERESEDRQREREGEEMNAGEGEGEENRTGQSPTRRCRNIVMQIVCLKYQ